MCDDSILPVLAFFAMCVAGIGALAWMEVERIRAVKRVVELAAEHGAKVDAKEAL